MRFVPYFLAAFALTQQCSAQYVLNIMLVELNAGQGFLANGSRCSPFWFDNVRCSIDLHICVEPLTGLPDGDLSNCKGTLSKMDNLTQSANKMVFSPDGKYGEWTNPVATNVTTAGTYAGFQLKVKVTHNGTFLIDNFVHIFDSNGTRIADFEEYSHPRSDAPENIMIHIAWTVTGNTTISEPTPSPTSAPKPHDCDFYVGKGSGVKKIYGSGSEVEVYCDMGSANAYTVIQSRGNDSSESFDSFTYENYKKQQGKAGWDTNFWFGLENMQGLISSKKNYALAIQLCCGNVPATSTFYQNLTMGNEQNGYALGGTTLQPIGMGLMTTGEDLYANFSTYTDWHNKMPAAYCDVIDFEPEVVKGTGGWWFGSCTNNLNGHYYDPEKDKEYFEDPSKCLLNKAKLQKYGSGIEMRTTVTIADEDHGAYDGVSYTRVRMALFNADIGAPGGVFNFCSETPPPTSPPATTTIPTATTAPATAATAAPTTTATAAPTTTAATLPAPTVASTAPAP